MSIYRLIDEISEMVYVADMDTYELLFLNRAGREIFHLKEITGKKCYQVLQGLDGPCPFCTNRLLSYEEFYCWEYTNPIVGRHCLLKDRMIGWEGRRARLEIALDVTEQARQQQELQCALKTEQTVLACVKKLHEQSEPEAAIDYILEEVGRFLEADRSYIFEIRGERMDNTFEWCREGVEPEKERLQGESVHKIDRWIEAFRRGEDLWIEDTESLQESAPREYEDLRAQGIRTLAVCPLELRDQLYGFIGVDNPRMQTPRVFSLLRSIAYFVLTGVERIRTGQMLTRLSYFDMLTGLGNRNQYMRAVRELEADPAPGLGVIYLDVNGLKSINDLYGHPRGDEVLSQAARMIREVLPGEDAYRIGGDEFVVFCRGVDRMGFQEKVTQLRNGFQLTRDCQTALGYAWSESGGQVERLVAIADEMMYADKKRFYRSNPPSGRYRYSNDDALGLADPETLAREIRAGRFLVYLQPKVSFADRGLIGAEALVRYQDRKGGVVPPDQFIPTLEEAKLIGQVDFYVYEFTCARIREWISQGLRLVPVSVNFSRYTLLRRDFIERLNAVWEAYEIPRELVEVEITESVEDVDGEYMLSMIRRIKDAEFAISIDDFGSRYANLALFTSANIDTLKVDKSLLCDLTTNAKSRLLLGSLAMICRNLGIQFIVEGVETEEQFQILNGLGCDGAQGYLFSRPLPIGRFEELYLGKPTGEGDAKPPRQDAAATCM